MRHPWGFGNRNFLRVLVVSAAVIFLTAVLASAGEERCASECRRIAGKWHADYSGINCEGEPENGTFTLLIRSDCSYQVQRRQMIPFFSTDFVEEKSLCLQGQKLTAVAEAEFDGCGPIRLSASIVESGRALRLEGSYHYGKNENSGGEFSGYRLKDFGK